MKMLIVSHNNNENSGANRSLISLINMWKDKYEIVVLVNKTKGNLKNVLSESGVRCISMPYGWNCVPRRHNILRQAVVFVREYCRYMMGIFHIHRNVNMLKKEKFDIVYSNTSVIDIGARIAGALSLPHVWHFREYGKKDFGFIYLIPFQHRLKWIRLAKAVIVISNALKKQYEKFVSEERLFMVYNGFELDELVFDRPHDREQEFNVLISGQLGYNKGQHQAIQAVVELHRKYNVHLYIAGKGDQIYLERELKKYDFPSYIHVLGQVDNIFELRKKMDVELVCSANEAFGRVTIEAMLHSVPVIGADCGGTPELIEDGITGFLYENENIDSLKNKIEMLILDESLRLRIAKKAFCHGQKFTIAGTAEQIDIILQKSLH